MRGEDRGGAQPLERLVRRQALLLHELAHALELEERGVALVQVEDCRLEPEPAQHPDAADTEQDLLPQPVRPVAAVERVGDGPVRVSLDLGVDQEEGRAADSHAPDAEPYRDELAAVVGELDHGSHRHEL